MLVKVKLRLEVPSACCPRPVFRTQKVNCLRNTTEDTVRAIIVFFRPKHVANRSIFLRNNSVRVDT